MPPMVSGRNGGCFERSRSRRGERKQTKGGAFHAGDGGDDAAAFLRGHLLYRRHGALCVRRHRARHHRLLHGACGVLYLPAPSACHLLFRRARLGEEAHPRPLAAAHRAAARRGVLHRAYGDLRALLRGGLRRGSRRLLVRRRRGARPRNGRRRHIRHHRLSRPRGALGGGGVHPLFAAHRARALLHPHRHPPARRAAAIRARPQGKARARCGGAQSRRL